MNSMTSQSDRQARLAFDPVNVRADFPILNQKIHRQRDLIYFDNGASTQHPTAVIEAMSECYRQTYANVHRGIHWLSEQASAQFESARETMRAFINARDSSEVIFTSGTTASINLVARSWGGANLAAGDEVLLTIFEHHSNIVPWQQIAAQTGAILKFAGITSTGELDWEDFQRKLTPRTKMVAVSAISNTLGSRIPVRQIVELGRVIGAVTLVDAAQHTPHEPTDVQFWNADFVAFSGHKMLGPSGIGILWGKLELLQAMPPFLGGGGMIAQVTTDGYTCGELPAKFEAGTPPIVEAIGLAAAAKYLNQFPFDELVRHESKLVQRMMEGMTQIQGLRIFGPAPQQRSGIVSFVVDGISSQDLAVLLDRKGIAVRAGHHCTMPLHEHLGIRASCRASVYLYNTMSEVDYFVEELNQAIARLR